jgi:hypothetical protein
MFSLFSSKKSELGIIFDVGTSSVAAALVKFEEGKTPHVVHTVREVMTFQENVDPVRLFGFMIDALKTANERIAREGVAHLKFTEHGSLSVKKVYFVFAHPWSVSETKIISVHKEEPFEVTQAFIKELLEKEEELFEQTLTTTGNLQEYKHKLAVVGKEVIQTKLNGYDSKNPYGKYAKTLDLAFSISIVPKEVLEKAEEVTHRAYHLKDSRSFSFPIVAFSTLRDIFKKDDDFIFLDIAGEIADITIVKSGVVVENSNFPLGKNFLYRKVAEALKEPYEVGASLLRAHLEGHVEEQVSKTISKILDSVRVEWLRYFDTALIDISTRVTLPNRVYLIAGNEFVPFFIEAIQQEKITQFGMNGAAFSVEVIDHEHMSEHVTFAKSAYKDSFLALEAVFINKILHSK